MNYILNIFVAVLLLSVIAAQTPSLLISARCGLNEQYTTCGSACPPTCADLRYPLPKPAKLCILLCKSGCFCAKGYYRADDGKCVLPSQCCGENETYEKCGPSSVETCGKKASACSTGCVAGCFCSCSDYVRNGNSTGSPCIPRADCPTPCPEDD